MAEAGTGRMSAALTKLNPELLRNIRAATSQEERVRLAADAIAATGSASEKAALSVALFGDAGAKLADVFAGGSKAIDSAMASAKRLGLIVSRDLIARADELGDEFDTATKVLDLQFKQALVDLAPILTSTDNSGKTCLACSPTPGSVARCEGPALRQSPHRPVSLAGLVLNATVAGHPRRPPPP